MVDLAKRPSPQPHESPDLGPVERVIAAGDLSKLSPEDRATYYLAVCRSLGLNALSQPFQYLVLNGKLILYATRGATDQLRSTRGVSVEIVRRERIDDIYVVTARATMPDGRTDESTGAVPIKGLQGEGLANGLMKCETKAKRRVTLSIVGLGWLDESEVDAIPNARVLDPQHPAVEHYVEPPAALPAKTSSRRREEIRRELDQAVAESDALVAEPVAAEAPSESPTEEEEDSQAPSAPLDGEDELAPLRQEALDLYAQALAAGVRTAEPHPRATEAALHDYVARHKRALAARSSGR